MTEAALASSKARRPPKIVLRQPIAAWKPSSNVPPSGRYTLFIRNHAVVAVLLQRLRDRPELVGKNTLTDFAKFEQRVEAQVRQRVGYEA